MGDFIQHGSSLCAFASSDSWVILSPIEQSIKRKIEAVGTPLKDWDIQINYGIKTGCNDAFIISTERRDEILAGCQTEEERRRSEEIIRPILKDNSVKKYELEWDNRYLINFHNGYISENGSYVEYCNPVDFPSIIEHIDSIAVAINEGRIVRKGGHKGSNNSFENRSDRGKTIYNLRNCAYIEKFNQPKIVWKQTSIAQTFMFDDKGFYLDVSGQFLTSKSLSISAIKALLSILNSKLVLWYLQNNAVKFGSKGIRWIPDIMFLLPIPSEIKENEFLAGLVDNRTNSGNVEIEAEIDRKVYELYGLTDEEIEVVEKS